MPYVALDGLLDVLYLPPIHPIGRAYRKGPNNSLTPGPHDPGSPWAIGGPEGGHKAIHPELGTLDDFDRLVASAGTLGLELALDIAFPMLAGPPVRQGAPRVVPASAGRHDWQVCGEPAEEISGYLSDRF